METKLSSGEISVLTAYLIGGEPTRSSTKAEAVAKFFRTAKIKKIKNPERILMQDNIDEAKAVISKRSNKMKVSGNGSTVKEKKKRIMRFKFPPMRDVRTCKNTKTLRSKCEKMLLAGATFDDVVKLVQEFDNSRKIKSETTIRRAYELVRLMHYSLGYGIEHNIDTGLIKIYTGN